MENYVPNFLNFPRFCITDVKETENDYFVVVHTELDICICPHCGEKSDVYRWGTRNQLFLDLPMHNKRVGISVIRKRFKCRKCLRTYYEPLLEMDDKRLVTLRLIKYIQIQSLSKTFMSVSDEVGLDEKTIRNIFNDYAQEIDKSFIFKTPKWLGIDEIYIKRNRPICVLSDIEHKKILDILPNRNKATVETYLKNVPNRDRIELVSMDMWNPYREACKIVLPQAHIVVDKFHVIRLATKAMNMIRKDFKASLSVEERKAIKHDRNIFLRRKHELNQDELSKLNEWSAKFEILGSAYLAKEGFFDIWISKDRKEAINKYEEWRLNIQENILYAFRPIVRAVDNWDHEIFAHFDFPITNAYAEALNNIVRFTNRMGRGYTFEVLRTKMLESEGQGKKRKAKYGKHDFNDSIKKI